ncbi:CRISPR-associated endonuclease Cas2 [Marinitoga aeolica]|uniref:CRISPR-associated endoribonuclease Cas2 n=1 Tax=Marinitoga aeolica TaxID=2809031 RepID=A0ABY8PRC6_9BACT|nr:CRISPR-associated endonuclease Cas2 [Marinitoga aeolica]WGS65194.1 CRISPR-associated endonuclease Cas2 [Marinitoga aeolica]
MYVIMVYDVNPKKVAKVLKKSRKYLNWIQNSVLEGEITEKDFKILKDSVEKILDKNVDTIYWYIMKNSMKPRTYILGESKGKTSNIIV